MGVSGNGIAAHGFRADAEGEIDLLQGDGVGGLADGLHAGAADTLHQVRRAIDGHAGVQADVPRQDIGVETRLGHASGDDRVHIGSQNSTVFENPAGRFDAEVNRRNQAQHAGVVRKGRANPVQQPDILVGAEKTAASLSHDAFSLEPQTP